MEQQKNRNVYLTPNTSCLASSTTSQKQKAVSCLATHVLFFFLFTICVLLALPLSAHASVFTKPANNLGLVGYWNFNEGTSTYAGDFSANSNVGVLTNMANPPTASSGWGNGKFGGGMNFDGTDDYVSVLDQNYYSPSVNDVTVSFWAKIETNATPGDDNGCGAAGDYLIAKGITSQWEWGFENDGNDRFCMTLWQLNGQNHMSIGVLRTMNDGKWHHFVGVMDYLTQYTIFVDGVSVGTTASYTGTMTNGTQPFEIGRRGTGDNAQATVDDVRVFSRALTASQISALYQNGSARFASSQTLTQGTTLTNGLVGHWTFDGSKTTNTTALDSSGQNNTGTFSGFTRATNAKAGKLGQGMNFDNVNDSVNIGVNPTFDGASAITISAWIRPSASMSDDAIVGKATGVANQIYFWVGHSGLATNQISWNAGPGWLEATQTLILNEWTHVVGTADASGHKIFYNGVLISSNSSAIDISASNAHSWLIGSMSGNRIFNGSIDDVRIYNRALSAGEVKQLYNLGSAKAQASSVTLQQGTTLGSGIVGHWTFDGKDTTTTTALDRSGQNNTGTFTGFTRATNAKAGKLGQGMSFDGTNDYVDMGDVLDQTGSFTLSAWVKRAGDSITGNASTIIGKEMVSSAQFAFEIIDTGQTNPNTVRFITFGLATNNLYSTQTITNGQWYHIVATFDSSSITQKIYIDGVQNATQTTTGTMTANSNTLKIGYSQGTGDSSNYFNGNIDDVRVYNRALSPSEVKQLYLMGK